MIRRLLSFIYPVRIYQGESAISKSLELTWVNGKLLLDSANANYSYGSLERVLRQGLKAIGFSRIRKMDRILVLGVAGGSVVKVLINEAKFSGLVTGVDIDPDVIALARKYYHLDRIKNLELVISDASEYIKSAKSKFDLVIIDIFEDKLMPAFVYDPEFVLEVTSKLEKDGYILFNTIVLDKQQQRKNDRYAAQFPEADYEVTVLPKLKQFNELIIVRKR